MYTKVRMLAVIVAGTLLVSSASASAAVTVYTNQAAFNAAVSGAASYGFAGIAPTNSPNPGNNFIVINPTVNGVTFTSTTANGAPFVIDTSSNSVYGVPFFSGQGNAENIPANNVTVTLPGYGAFGFTYGSYISSAETYSATLNTGDVFNFSTGATNGTPQFIGFVSDTPLTSASLTSTAGPNDLTPGGNNQGYGYAFDIINFSLGSPTAGAVPEPATWAMMLLGFGMVGFAMRKRSNVRTKVSYV